MNFTRISFSTQASAQDALHAQERGTCNDRGNGTERNRQALARQAGAMQGMDTPENFLGTPPDLSGITKKGGVLPMYWHRLHA